MKKLLYLLQKKMQPYKLRPHHGLCSNFFCGHGYSANFTEHMTKTLLHFQQHNPQILLTVGADCICAACPHCCHDCCSSAEQVERYDRAVLNSCGLREGDVLDWNTFRRQVQEQILHTEIFPHICGTCSWYSICSRKEAAAISQAFLQKQILP